ncbi:MAG: HAD-IIIA family hydrolase [Phycisphaerales bacterium]|nr:HAD-IIIA family hydrolase [Phycisphaerales bacterium]MCB9857282.1 HAD-IIIA family hydrolase [Phycisphaerales bacterium]MCB9863004.1 HAD-IIIA family hydrolase [Phycisphaerales bacterium]
MSNHSRPAVFVDRDNTLIADPGYLRDPNQIRILPGVPDAVKRLREAGFVVVIVTNQSGVARGYFTENELRIVHERLQELLAEKGAAVDAIYYCPFLPGRAAVVEEYRDDSELRKPKPGMILKAAEDMRLDVTQSWMVGDSARDVQAGNAAGCRTILLGSGATDPDARPHHTMSNFPAAADFILRESKRVAEMKAVLDAARRESERAPKRESVSVSSRRPIEPAAPPVPTPIQEKKDDRRNTTVDDRSSPRSESEVAKTEPSSMESSTARTDTAKTDPRSDGASPAESDVRPAVDHARQALDRPRQVRAADSPFEVLDEILDEVRAMRRERNFTEFSIAQLAGAIAQAFAICAVCFGLYWAINNDPNGSTLALLTGIAFQLMALTGFLAGKRR